MEVIILKLGGKNCQHSATEEDDISLYNCAKKYDMIVKQFDEFVGIINNSTTLPKSKKGRKASASATSKAASSNQPKSKGTLVEAVTRFLHELRS